MRTIGTHLQGCEGKGCQTTSPNNLRSASLRRMVTERQVKSMLRTQGESLMLIYLSGQNIEERESSDGDVPRCELEVLQGQGAPVILNESDNGN